jgi:hypothetical protein
MALSAKLWVGLAMSSILILFLLIDHRLEDRRMFKQDKGYCFDVRKKIAWHLAQLRQQYGSNEVDVYLSTLVDIQELSRSRDLCLNGFNKQTPTFSADSLRTLQALVEQGAPFLAVCHEIDRIQQMNEKLNNLSQP